MLVGVRVVGGELVDGGGGERVGRRCVGAASAGTGGGVGRGGWIAIMRSTKHGACREKENSEQEQEQEQESEFKYPPE